ncbi:MAG: hypothetical protein IKE42_15955 [Aquamicrobium sp.]|nr:hypothetical protein [Aquamicrobium sp.]
MKVVIYQDNVSANGTLYSSLGRLFGKTNVSFVDAYELADGALNHGVDIFVMPGGSSRYKEAKLRGCGNEVIKRYVSDGGAYVGICAGAYMGCEITEWAIGTQYEITRHNDLSFFAGKAIGPIPDFSTAGSYNGSGARLVELDFGTHKARSLYWGGCHFVGNQQADFTTVATFSGIEDKPIAIVRGEYGAGRWLLSSTHI